MWSPSTKPTADAIRKRISAAQEAIDGAMDLIKQREDPDRDRTLKALDQAYAWLANAHRPYAKKPKGKRT